MSFIFTFPLVSYGSIIICTLVFVFETFALDQTNVMN